MKRLNFRTRVLLYLVLFAVVPSTVLMLGGAAVVSSTLPVLSGSRAWDNVAATGRRAIDAVRRAPLTPAQRSAVDAHEQELAASLVQAKRYSYITSRAVVLVVGARLLGEASCATVVLSTISLCSARLDWVLPTIPISRLPKFFIKEASTFISGLSPLLLMIITMSSC